MAPIAIWTGIALIILGAGGYGFATMQTEGYASATALIPAAFGLLILILGLLARNDRWRMHAMHGAALLGLVGVVVPLVNIIRRVADGTATLNLGLAANVLMFLICGVFLALCINSFISARRQRTKPE